MAENKEGKFYQKVKGNRCPVYLHDENFSVTASIYLSKAVSKDYLIKMLDEAKADFPMLKKKLFFTMEGTKQVAKDIEGYDSDEVKTWYFKWFVGK